MGLGKLNAESGGNIEQSIVTPTSTAPEFEQDLTSSTNSVDNSEQSLSDNEAVTIDVPSNVSENYRRLDTSEGKPINDIVNFHDKYKIVNNKELAKTDTPLLSEQGDHDKTSYNDNKKDRKY